LLAIPVGLATGYFIGSWISWAYALELFRIPFVITPASYLLTVVSVLASAGGSAFVVHRRIMRLNLVSAIKTME
jgi:putative ABC transport system permease protein